MSEKSVTASTASTASVDLKSIKSVAEQMEVKHLAMLRGLVTGLGGLKLIPDPTGMMCGPNDYCLVVGARLYAKLSGKSEAECCSWKGEGSDAE